MRTDPFVDPLQFLTACHGRIRMRLFTFLRAAARLRGAGAIERHELEAALLFFRSSGEGHTIDEEQSLFPRLRARLLEAGEQEAVGILDGMVREHRAHDAAFEAMVRAMAAIDPTLGSGDGLPDPEAAGVPCGTPEALALADALEALVAAYEEHIPVEDDVLYPLAARVMPAEELAQVAAEMRGRRRLGRKLLG
ncbi:hemerythrin domain-containing protein [Vulgatibacter sp.]|uniref:hemerythrin domain-containing protein n=1 Tax=Vulgatibacter sp. TaxID=1971226 RepID=UPI00356B36D1